MRGETEKSARSKQAAGSRKQWEDGARLCERTPCLPMALKMRRENVSEEDTRKSREAVLTVNAGFAMA